MRRRLTLILCCFCLPASIASPARAQDGPAQYAPGPAEPQPPIQFPPSPDPTAQPPTLPNPPVSSAPYSGLGPVAAPTHGMLLLKNGETLEGKISAAGDYYLVVAENTEMQVRARDVEAACRDLDDVVAHKAAKLNPRSADDRIALAQWCIDRELYGIAARELAAAWQIDDTHPRIPLLERRMKAAMSAPRAVPPPPKVAPPSIDEATVNAALAGLSSESVHDFTVRVQPLMMNYCATAGCHGPKPKSDFQLERVYLNELNDSRVVRRNLYAALKLVNRGNPATSKLLTVPLTPHGGGKNALFHAHNAEHYRQLAIWVGNVAAAAPGAPAGPTTAAATTPTDPLLQRLPIAPPGGPASTSVAQSHVAQSPVIPSPAVKSPTAGVSTAPTGPAERPAVDPFDPEIFNRGRAAAKP